MTYDLEIYIIIFLFYSVAGWLMEVGLKLVSENKLINRGFLIGPYCPIYGCGALLITILLEPFQNNIILLFGMAILICSILEYFTSYLMEKLFHARWWDYSDRKYNLNGRICLNTIIPFGILGCLAMYLINPLIIDLANDFNKEQLRLALTIYLLLFASDFIGSLVLILKVKNVFHAISGDNTIEINKKIRERLLNMTFPTKRLIKAYPNFKVKIKHDIEDIEAMIKK